MLTDEKLTELFRYSFGLIDSRMTPNQQAFCRLIESAACAERDARIAEQDELIARLRLEAQLHAQEARTANATIAEIYQVVTGSTGEPGNWHGAAPVKARIAELTRELEEARKDAERYQKIIAVCESDGFGYWLPEVCLKEGNLPPSKQESDAAIDAAIKEQT